MTRWTEFVKQYANENKLSYRESLKQAGQHYKKKSHSAKSSPRPQLYKKVDNILLSPQQQMPSVVATHPNNQNDTLQLPSITPMIQQQKLSNVQMISPEQQLKTQMIKQQDIFKSMMDQINYNYKIKSRELMMTKINSNQPKLKMAIKDLRNEYELQKQTLIVSQRIVSKTLLDKLNSIRASQQLYIRV